MVDEAAAWTEIGDGVYVRRYRSLDQAIGAIATDVGVVVIDTRSAYSQADELLADLRILGRGPVAAVANTHLHYDHCLGNHRFRPAPIWGHVRCRTGLLAAGERQREAAARALPELAAELGTIEIDPPDRTFEEAATLDVGGRRIQLRYLGRGHTDNDIVVLVPDAAVLFAGDLLENGAPPSFGDGFPLDWPETASRLLELVRGPVVPGHGDVGDRAFAEDQLASLLEIARLGRAVHRGDLALPDAVSVGPYGPVASREPIERALAQLRGELDRPAG